METLKKIINTAIRQFKIRFLKKPILKQQIEINGNSMYPVFKDGQIINAILDPNKQLKIGQIVLADIEGQIVIKRVLAVGGDSIFWKGGRAFINGIKHYEPISIYIQSNMEDIEEIKVPKGFVYLCGDNRNNSTDSRHYGPVRAKDCVAIFKPKS